MVNQESDTRREDNGGGAKVAAGSGTGEKIVQKLVEVFNRLAEVKVVTILEQVELDIKDPDERTKATITPFKKSVNALVTVINLVDGDVINIIAPDLQADADLRAFHAAQVDKSMAVLPANIAAMIDLGKAIIREFP